MSVLSNVPCLAHWSIVHRCSHLISIASMVLIGALLVDAASPNVRLIEPAQFSMLRSDAIRIRAEATGGEAGVRTVGFFVNYQGPQRLREGTTDTIGWDSTPPYEVIWDCSRILDQPMRRLGFWCVAEDSAGKHGSSQWVRAALDRHIEYSTLTASADRVRRDPVIDGKFGETEWPGDPTIVYVNGDNRYAVHVCWTATGLFIALRSRDDRLFSRFTSEGQPSWDTTTDYEAMQRLYLDDGFIVFLDPARDRGEAIVLDDIIVSVSCWGSVNAYRLNARDAKHYNILDSINVATTFDTSADSGVSVTKIHLPWSVLKPDVAAGDTLGFDLYMVDRESVDGARTLARWAGQPHNHENPSEWGSLVLDDERVQGSTLGLIAALVGVCVVVAAFLVAPRRRRSPKDAPDLAPVISTDPMVAAAIKFIDDNLDNEELCIEMVARRVGLNKDYFGRKFGELVGQTFVQLLNERRMARAKELLGNPDINISQAALQCGYGTPDHFTRVFRNHYGMTPRKYRNNR